MHAPMVQSYFGGTRGTYTTLGRRLGCCGWSGYIKATHLQSAICLLCGLTFLQLFSEMHCHSDVSRVVIDENLSEDYRETAG